MFSIADVVKESQTHALQNKIDQKADDLQSNDDADKIIDLCRQMIEVTEGAIAPGRSALKNKKTEHANLKNVFKSIAGKDPSHEFTLPWYYKVLNPWSTLRNALFGGSSNFAEGQRDLYERLTDGRADVPGWLYQWAPKAWQPLIRDKCNNFFRPIVGFSDVLPFRAIKAFCNPANAQFEHLTRLQEFSVDTFHRNRAVLQREIHKILLRNKPEFAEAVCYKLFQEGLIAANYACDELSPDDAQAFQAYIDNNNIPNMAANLLKDDIINFQTLKACEKLAGSLTGLFKQGNNRLAFLGANLVDGLAYPQTTKAHREAMTALVAHELSREDKIRKIQKKGWGTQPPLALMIRQIMDHGVYGQNVAKALVDPAPIFEVDKDNVSAWKLYFNTPNDISFAGTDRIFEKLGNSNEAGEWSFMPGSGHLDTLKYEKPLFRRMHGGEYALRFRQQSAADFFVNIIADAFIQIDASEERLASGKNDNPAEVDYLAGHYRRLQVASDAFFQHCKAFLHVNGGVLPRDVCDATGLPKGSKVPDLIGQVIKRIRPYYESRHRFVDIKPENLDKIDKTWIDKDTLQPFAVRTVDVVTGSIEYPWTSPSAEARFEQAERAYTEKINARLTAVAASHQRIAGIINSMSSQYGAAKRAAEELIAQLPQQGKTTDYPHIKITRPTKENRYATEQVIGTSPEERGYRAVVYGGGTIKEFDGDTSENYAQKYQTTFEGDPLLLLLAERQATAAALR